VCPEHGELVEAGHAPAADVPDAEDAAAPVGNQLRAARSSASIEDAHCAVSALHKNQLTPQDAPLWVPVAPLVIAAFTALPDADLAAPALFRTAPKQSPPA
jgi:hypothetical protein